MSHFAKIENGIVTQVIVAEQEFIDSKVLDGIWVQTSYNTRGGVHYDENGKPDEGVALRKNYAGIGYIYDEQRDAFIPPPLFPSWLLNENSCLWNAPIPMPNDGNSYMWNETTLSWIPE